MDSSSYSGISVPSAAVEKPRRKRTLDDKDCEVCEDKSTGKHYGVYVCDGCSGFFKRTVRRAIPWVCRNDGKCIVDRASRTDCRACRFRKCLMVNMNPEGVQTRTVSRESGNKNNEGDSNNSISMNASPELDQPAGTIVQTVREEESSTSSTSSLSTSNCLVPGSSTSSSPPISMAMAGGSEIDFQSRTHSPVLIKVETERSDTFIEEDKSTESIRDNLESRRKDSVTSSQVSGQPSSAQTGLATVRQAIRPVIPFTPRASQLVPTQMMIVPNTPFTPRYPYQPSLFPSPRYALTDRVQIHSPASTEVSLPVAPKESVHNLAVQLLSNSVQFAKNIYNFNLLPFRDQVILLEECWKDMFVLDAAFYSFPLEISYILPPGEATKEANAQLVSSLRVLQELVTRIQALGLDETECAYLKTVVIFKPDIKGLKDSHQIEKLQDEAQVKLSEYTRTSRVGNPARFGRLLLTLLAFERVSLEMIEKLFFRAQNYGVEYILHDVFKKT